MIMILVINTISLFEVDKEKLVSVSATPMYVYTKMNILDLNLGFVVLISRQITGGNLFGEWLHLTLHHLQQLGILECLTKWNESLTSDNTRFSTFLFFLPYFPLCYFPFYSNVISSLYFTEIFVFRGPSVDWSLWNISYCSICYYYCSITFINLQSLSIEAAFTKG